MNKNVHHNIVLKASNLILDNSTENKFFNMYRRVETGARGKKEQSISFGFDGPTDSIAVKRTSFEYAKPIFLAKFQLKTC